MSSLIEFAGQYRTTITRVFAVFLILILLFTHHSWGKDGAVITAFELIGVFLISICVLGRIWCSLFIAGQKIHALVDVGPYSAVRHPLYFFSFFGAAGIGFYSKNVLLLAILVGIFLIHYWFVMLHEERQMMEAHGEAYAEYMKRVPRFIPKPALYREPEKVTVDVRLYRRTFTDVVWFIWAIIPLEIIDRLHDAGILPVLYYLP
jgi:protein-S-isoprenylcysteine O-methyltransferase Ste14